MYRVSVQYTEAAPSGHACGIRFATQAVKAMEIEILTEGICIVHQLNFAIVCFVYELVLQHGICTVTCVATPQKSVRKLRRVSDYSKGCQHYFMALQER